MSQRPKKQNDAYYYALAMRMATDLLLTIAIPALLAAFLGKWLDERWGTQPLCFVLLLIVSFCLTGLMIRRKAKMYAKLYNRED